MSQNIAGLCPPSLKVTTYISHMILSIQCEQHANVLKIIAMTIAHKNKKSCLPVNDAIFVQEFNSHSQLGRVVSR